MTSPSRPDTQENPAGPRVDDENPWLGLTPFTEDSRRYFFGRREEIRDLFLRVHRSTLTVLFGQSGLGKTSLLGAGLLPRLRAEGYRPWLVRLRFDDEAPPAGEQTRLAFRRCVRETGGADTAAIGPPAGGRTLWEELHHRELRPVGLERCPPVLVFDQFEELFTLGEERRPREVAEFMAELADAIENRPPAALTEVFRQDRQVAARYDFGPAPLRVVLTLREDYLSCLEGWRQAMPSVMRNRMVLRLLRGPQALEAVVEPGRVGGHELISEAVGAQIVRFVARQRPDVPLEEIDAVPPLVSLVCRELNSLRLAAGQPSISEEHLTGRSEDILEEFYKRCFAGQPPELRRYVEDRFLTATGFRSGLPRETAESELADRGVPATALDDLVRGRLLTTEDRRGLQWLELTHDVLAPLVARSRSRRREREARERAENEAREAKERAARDAALREEEARERAEEARRQGMLAQAQAESRRRGRLAGALAAAMILAGVSFVTAFQRYRHSAGLNRQLSDTNRLLAMTAGRLADTNEALVQVTRDLRLASQELASSQGKLEDQNRQLVTAAAELRSRNAELSRATNELSVARDQATSSAALAERERAEAETNLRLAKSAETRRAIAQFDGQVASAALLGQLENFREANRALGETDAFRFREVVSADRVTARNLLRWFVNLHSRTASLTNRAPVPLSDLAIDPSARTIVAVGEEVPEQGGYVGLFRISPGAEATVLAGHSRPVTSVAASPDGGSFVTGGLDRQLLRWRLPEGRVDGSWRLSAPLRALAFGPDGRWVGSCGPELGLEVHVLAGDPELVRFPDDLPGAMGLSFDPGTGWLCVVTTNGLLSVRRIVAGSRDRLHFSRPRLLSYVSALQCVAMDRTGERVATGAEDGSGQLWLPGAGSGSRPERVLRGHRGGVLRVAFHPTDTRLLATSGRDGTVRLWDVETGQTLKILEGHEGPVSGLAVTSNRLFTCSSDKTWRAWEWGSSDRGYRSLPLTNGEPASCVLSPDGARVVVGFTDGTLLSVALPNLTTEWSLRAHTGRVTRMVFLQRGRSLASVALDGQLALRESATGRETRRLEVAPVGATCVAVSSETDAAPVLAFGGSQGSVAVSADGRLGLSGSSGVIGLLNTADGSVTSWRAHSNEVLSLSFNRADGSLFSVGREGQLLRWDLANRAGSSIPTSTNVSTHGPGMSAAGICSPRGRWLAHMGRSGSIELRDLRSGAFRELLGHQNTVLDAVFTASEGQLLTVSTDATVRAWDLTGGNGAPLLFTIPLPVPGGGLPVSDFDFLPRSSRDGSAWLAVPLVAPPRLVVYPLGGIEELPEP